LDKLSQRCPRFEVFKWNNNGVLFFADGRYLTSIKNLKELYLDGGIFLFNAESDEDDDDTDDNTSDDDDDDDDDVSEDREMADMQNPPNIVLFYKLCKNNPLERVSIFDMHETLLDLIVVQGVIQLHRMYRSNLIGIHRY